MQADVEAAVRRAEQRLDAPPRVSERWPALYPLAVRVHQARRHYRWLREPISWAARRPARAEEASTVRVRRHRSLLLRRLQGAEMELQHNKVHNLRLAAASLDGVVIGPGETFSFNRLVGNCNRRRGYVEGMRLSNGRARPGVGGGICQMANLLAWMFMHSALTVVERSEHSFDPFPDQGRVLPWGVGCSIVWNYVDLVVRNDTASTFVIRVGVGERYLEGELLADREQEHSYSVHEREGRFVRRGERVFRLNQIWRDVIDRRTGRRTDEELLKANCALVTYDPPEELLEPVERIG